RDSTNEPVATPAQAGLGALMGASTLARARRPFASSTACPIAAAKAKTSRTGPIAKSAWVSASMSGRGCASGRRAGRSQRRHRVVDLQDEAARAARVDERRAPGAALGADDRGAAPAHRAAGRPGWQAQPIERAIRLARRVEGFAVDDLCRPGLGLDIRDAGAGLAGRVHEPAEAEEGHDGADDTDQQERRKEGEQ